MKTMQQPMLLYLAVLYTLLVLSSGQSSSKCSSGERRVQSETRLVSNGCSKPPGIDIAGEENFTYCCDRHDACYESCGSSRDYCDKEFSKCMRQLCDTAFSHNKQCKSAAEMYFMGVNLFGQGGFEDSQDQHCTCIEASKVNEHYVYLVKDFYDTHVTTTKTEGEVKALVEGKGGNIKRLAMLVFSLYKKYGHAIEYNSERAKQTAVSPRPTISKEL